MATFPTGLFSWTSVNDNTDDVLASHPNEIAGEVEAAQAKIGVDSSVVTSSHDYKLRNLPGQAGDWDAGAVEVRAQTFESDVATGTAPIVVASTTNVINLNASTLNAFSFISGDLLLSSSTSAHSGWTDVTATYTEKFIRISTGTALDTGGADTHTHGAGSYAGPSHTHTGTTDGASAGGAGSLTINTLLTQHVHTFTTASGGTGAVTGTSASGDNVPAYIQLKMWQKD